MKRKETVKILSQKEISPGIFDLWLETDLAGEAHAGQFVGVYTGDPSMILPRPISICEVSDDFSSLRLVYRVAGKGTKLLSGKKQGESHEILGILGNGYEFNKIASVIKMDPENETLPELSNTEILLSLMDAKIVLLGGGIGIPPMLETAKELKAHGAEPVIIAGYRDADLFLKEDLEKYGTLYIATEDGSAGTKGNVLDALRQQDIKPDIILACGPMPMLRAVSRFTEEETKNGRRTEAFLSLEERMACGVGACLGCVTKTKTVDPHSHVKNARICTEGPVFWARELDI